MHSKTPFSKIIGLGFYDGPTSGVLQCHGCGAVYRFDMLDWDDGQDVRIFRLAALPANSLQECVEALAPLGPPRWPVWVPMFATDEARQAVERKLDDILSRARPAELLVAWVGYAKKVLAARKMSADELNKSPDLFSLEDPSQSRDWFALLNLPRRSSESTTVS